MGSVPWPRDLEPRHVDGPVILVPANTGPQTPGGSCAEVQTNSHSTCTLLSKLKAKALNQENICSDMVKDSIFTRECSIQLKQAIDTMTH